MEVAHPDVLHSRNMLDFGRGFYATMLKEQAERYAQRFVLRKGVAFLNVYEYTPCDGFALKTFGRYDEEWLDFVAKCRKGLTGSHGYDIIVGGIANDRIFTTIDLYFSGQISKEEALKRLVFEKPNNQICFANQSAIDKCVTFVEAVKISR